MCQWFPGCTDTDTVQIRIPYHKLWIGVCDRHIRELLDRVPMYPHRPLGGHMSDGLIKLGEPRDMPEPVPVPPSPSQRHRDRMLDEIEYWKERALKAEERAAAYAERLASVRAELTEALHELSTINRNMGWSK